MRCFLNLGLGDGANNSSPQKKWLRNVTQASYLNRFLVRILAEENRHEVWQVECKESVWGEFTDSSYKRIIKVQVRFIGSTGQIGERWH
jgi:hypothetical protein